MTKLLKEFLTHSKVTRPMILLKHYGKVIQIPLNSKSALEEIVKGNKVIAPLERVTGYGWVDSDLNIYHKDDPTVAVSVDDQTPSLRVKVRRNASISFFGEVLSSYRVNKVFSPSVISLIPLTHNYYAGDILLKPGAVNIHFDPMGENIKLPIYYKDGIMFRKHTVKKEVLQRKPFIVHYNNTKYTIPFRDIMYQVLKFDYDSSIVIYRLDDKKPFTIDNCILRVDSNISNYDKDLMVGV